MNILTVDFRKLQIKIEEYIKNNEQIYTIEGKEFIAATTKYTTPVLLMSDETFKLIKNCNSVLLKEKTAPTFWTLLGYYICIANWLPLGEIDIR